MEQYITTGSPVSLLVKMPIDHLRATGFWVFLVCFFIRPHLWGVGIAETERSCSTTPDRPRRAPADPCHRGRIRVRASRRTTDPRPPRDQRLLVRCPAGRSHPTLASDGSPAPGGARWSGSFDPLVASSRGSPSVVGNGGGIRVSLAAVRSGHRGRPAARVQARRSTVHPRRAAPAGSGDVVRWWIGFARRGVTGCRRRVHLLPQRLLSGRA